MEKNIENKLRTSVKNLGGLALKFTSPGTDGVPDRVVLKDGKVWFVELKDKGRKLRPTQRVVHEIFDSLGFPVIVVDDDESLKDFLKKL